MPGLPRRLSTTPIRSSRDQEGTRALDRITIGLPFVKRVNVCSSIGA
jgi:hypothetical protein